MFQVRIPRIERRTPLGAQPHSKATGAGGSYLARLARDQRRHHVHGAARVFNDGASIARPPAGYDPN
jgi:hypothetical protein